MQSLQQLVAEVIAPRKKPALVYCCMVQTGIKPNLNLNCPCWVQFKFQNRSCTVSRTPVGICNKYRQLTLTTII